MTVVLGTNFSEEARQAGVSLAALARRTGRTLLLAHVVSPSKLEALGPQLRGILQAALEREAERLGGRGLSVEVVLREGPVQTELNKLAAERSADFLMVAEPSGATFLGTSLKPSLLLIEASRPLLVLRDPALLAAWAAGARALRVTLGLDRSMASAAALAWTRSLRRYGQVELSVVRLYWVGEEALRLGFPPPRSFGDRSPEMETLLEREVHEALGDWPPGQILLKPSMGPMANQLVEAASQLGTDLLVVGTHRRTGVNKLWSVSHHALRLAKCSLALVPTAGVSPTELQPAVRGTTRVLVATDFSRAGDWAVPAAFSLVGQGGSVLLLHVADERPLSEARSRQLEAQLEALVPPGVEEAGKSSQVEVVAGPEVAAHILRAAERHGADVICLGAPGKHGLARAVTGPIASEVLRRCARPVLLVKPPPA